MKFNAGCGEQYVSGWVNADVVSPVADVRLDLAEPLPFLSGSVTHIFASHVLEHLDYREQLPGVLGEFARVLTADGELCVVGPDVQRAVLLGEPRQTLHAIVAWTPEFYAGDVPEKRPPAGHAWTATELLVELALEQAGFEFVNLSGMRLPKITAAGWPLTNHAPWQNGYICQIA